MLVLKPFILPIAAFISLSILAVFFTNMDYSWEGWQPAGCTSTKMGCFCEQIKEGTIRQPVNTWSSLTFSFLGLIILRRALGDLKSRSQNSSGNPMHTRMAYPLIFCSSLMAIGSGSAFYHASLSFVGQTWDVMGMYLFVSFYLVYNLSRFYRLKQSAIYVIFILINAQFLFLLIFRTELRRIIFAAALLTALFFELLLRMKKNIIAENRYLCYGLVVMLFSFFIWILDAFKIICFPQSVFQLHAIWHLGGATAAAFLYLYIRSEQREIGPPP